jgi:hypothetical protein
MTIYCAKWPTIHKPNSRMLSGCGGSNHFRAAMSYQNILMYSLLFLHRSTSFLYTPRSESRPTSESRPCSSPFVLHKAIIRSPQYCIRVDRSGANDKDFDNRPVLNLSNINTRIPVNDSEQKDGIRIFSRIKAFYPFDKTSRSMFSRFSAISNQIPEILGRNNSKMTASALPAFEKVRSTLVPSRRRDKIFVNTSKELDGLIKEGMHVSQLEIRGRSQPWRQDSSGALTDFNHSNSRWDGRDVQLEHTVLDAIWERARSGSKPGNRTDNFKIGLAIEGGGLRGCTTAGMASAIAHLGLSDSFDVVLGSSAGSIIGTYFVSKAPPETTYSFFCNHLTTSKEKLNGSSWLDIGRIVDLFTSQKISQDLNSSKLPVMVLDYPMKVLMQDLLPVDWKSFERNDKHQPMKIIASGLFSEDSVILGREEGSFHDLQSLCECVKASCMLPGVAGVNPFWLRAAPSRKPWKRVQGRMKTMERLSSNKTRGGDVRKPRSKAAMERFRGIWRGIRDFSLRIRSASDLAGYDERRPPRLYSLLV